MSMSPDEAAAFFESFIKDISKRCAIILELCESAVRPCPWDAKSVQLCLSHVSEWLMRNCETRLLTDDEIDLHASKFTDPIRTSIRETLFRHRRVHTDASVSLCIDCGILYIELYRANHPESRWMYEKGRNNAGRNIPYLKASDTRGSVNPGPSALPALVLAALRDGRQVDILRLYYLIGTVV